MKKVNLNNSKQMTGLTTLSNDELRNVYGGGKLVFTQIVTKEGKIIWELSIQ